MWYSIFTCMAFFISFVCFMFSSAFYVFIAEYGSANFCPFVIIVVVDSVFVMLGFNLKLRILLICVLLDTYNMCSVFLSFLVLHICYTCFMHLTFIVDVIHS